MSARGPKVTDMVHGRGARRREHRSLPCGCAAAGLLATLLMSGAQAACGPPTDSSPQEPAPISSEAAVPAYEGAWFSITPPPGFTARPSLPSDTAEGYDSAFFDSPDGRVVFYVCSPQWGRDATDVALDPARESLLAERATEAGGENFERLEITALDGTYARLVEVVFSPATAAQWTFGFQYADESAYEEYLDLYETFRASLEQYAD